MIKLMESMKEFDFLMLKEVYLKRCLSLEQAWLLFYKDKNVPYKDYCEKRIAFFQHYKVIKIIGTGKEKVIFLTNLGIDIVCYKFNIPTVALNSMGKLTNKKLTEADITLNPRLINHQVNLNQFVINFDKEFAKRYPEKFSKYFDEKYLSKYTHIRPDGMISLDNIDLFLEMDMGTESSKQLLDKFTGYRRFLDSREFHERDAKIIVLFILKTAPDKLQSRKDTVKKAILQTVLDLFPEGIEFYIGSEEELLNALYNKILPINYKQYKLDETLKEIFKKHSFSVSKGSKLKKVFYESSFRYYIRKLNKDKKIVVENGFVQEFVVDDYYYSPLSIVNKLSLIKKIQQFYKVYYNRIIKFVLIIPNLEEAYHDFKLHNILMCDGVYFTTIKRLSTMPMHKALFTMDSMGNIRNFDDTSYEKQQHEATMKKRG